MMPDWRRWFRSKDDDIGEEIQAHLRMAIEERVARGESPADAERNARREFGNVTHVSEVTREAHRGAWMHVDELSQDLRYAVRQLRASPGFTAATLVTLSLGIGVATFMYSVNEAVLSTPGGFGDVDRVVHVAQGTGGCNACYRTAQGNYLTVRSDARTISGVTLIGGGRVILRGTDRTQLVEASIVTPSFFGVLGIRPLLGRMLMDADTLAAEGTGPVVLNETLWRTEFGADSTLVGRTIALDAVPRLVVGVVPARQAFPRSAMLWGVRHFDAADAADRSWTNEDVIARLQPGVTLAQARAELATIGARVAAAFPETMKGWTFDAMRFDEWRKPRANDHLLTVGAAVALVVIIVCINLAGLLVARLTSRRKEIAVRAAMGAGRGRIVRQLLTETVLMALVSGVGGALLAGLALDAARASLPAFMASSLPSIESLRVDLGALTFALAASVVTGAAIAIWPAMRFTRPSLVDELKDGTRNATTASGVSRFRRGLVVAEVAFAIVLLAGATLLARSLSHLHAIEPGFRTDHLFTVRVQAPPRVPGDTARPDSTRYERLAERLTRIPGVTRAAAVVGLPFSTMASTSGFDIETPQGMVQAGSVRMLPVTPGYFQTMELPIVRGRAFTPADGPRAPRVTIISSRIAQRHFPDRDPLGAMIKIGDTRWTIVGVAGDTYFGNVNLWAQQPGEVYRPMSQWPFRQVQLALRTVGDPAQSARVVELAIRDFDPDLATRLPMTMDAQMSDDLAPSRLTTALMIGFALSAILISMIGLYGVISYSVAQRTREFGIRRALGAGTTTLIGDVLGQGARLILLGAAIGLAGAAAATGAMGRLIVGVSPRDPLTLLSVAALMCLVGLVAAYFPARRASRVDPMISLREE